MSNFAQTKLPSPLALFFCSAENSAVSWPMRSNISLFPIWTKAMFRALYACTAPICRRDIAGSMGAVQGAQDASSHPMFSLFSSGMNFDTSITAVVTSPFVGSREGITVSLSPAPSPPQAALSRPPAQPVAQQYSPALIKQRGTAGCVLLGHHSVPWTHCREKAEASQCYPSKNRFNCPVMHTLGSCNVLLIWSI